MKLRDWFFFLLFPIFQISFLWWWPDRPQAEWSGRSLWRSTPRRSNCSKLEAAIQRVGSCSYWEKCSWSARPAKVANQDHTRGEDWSSEYTLYSPNLFAGAAHATCKIWPLGQAPHKWPEATVGAIWPGPLIV